MKEYENDEEREDKLLKNWKEIIKNDDMVIHLGDFCFGGSTKMKELVSTLPGRKILVLGNHDNKPPLWYMERGFDFACYEFTWRNFIFTHKPIENTNGKINVHGHLHQLNSHHIEEYPWYNSENYFLVSMKDNNYKPINVSTL